MIVTIEPINGNLSIVLRGEYPPHTILHDEPIPTANPRNKVTIGVIDHIAESRDLNIERAPIYDALREAWNMERRAA